MPICIMCVSYKILCFLSFPTFHFCEDLMSDIFSLLCICPSTIHNMNVRLSEPNWINYSTIASKDSTAEKEHCLFDLQPAKSCLEKRNSVERKICSKQTHTLSWVMSLWQWTMLPMGNGAFILENSTKHSKETVTLKYNLRKSFIIVKAQQWQQKDMHHSVCLPLWISRRKNSRPNTFTIKKITAFVNFQSKMCP